jgi:hypothetical protein
VTEESGKPADTTGSSVELAATMATQSERERLDDHLLVDFAHFLVWTTAGNIVGGSVFVALLNYGHVAHFTGADVPHRDRDA